MLTQIQLAIQVIWLMLSTVRCNLQQTVWSLQSIRTFRTLLPGFIDSSLNLSSQLVSSKTATQIPISYNSKCNGHQETIMYQTYKDMICRCVIGWGLLETFWPWRWWHYIPLPSFKNSIQYIFHATTLHNTILNTNLWHNFFSLLFTAPTFFSLSSWTSSGRAWFFAICAAFVSTGLVEVLHIWLKL
jgi:hypothetical protein